tara:strand:- start:529 stop:855 length:327 start_codon:yes stop_codon:yes gene_type:complete
MAKKLILEQGVDDGVPLKAYVNRGRWVIGCECGGGEYAFEGGVVMCQSCWNSKVSHKYRLFTWPKEREKIEQLLIVRPLDNRNWFADELVADLALENNEHKAELIGGA